MAIRKVLSISLLGALITLPSKASFATAPALPEEVLKAKSVAVLVTLVNAIGIAPADFTDIVRSHGEEAIRKKGRFEVIRDPSKSDLVCLLVIYRPGWRWYKPYFGHHDESERYSTYYWATSVIVLKGGASRNWDPAPVWMHTYEAAGFPWNDHKYELNKFHAQFEKDQRAQQHEMPAAQQDGSTGSVDRFESGRTLFVTCLADCPKDMVARIETLAGNMKGRWRVVNEPAQADLVAVWFDVNYYKTGSVGVFTTMSQQKYAGLLIYKGRHADWNSTPWVSSMGTDAATLFQSFANSLQ